MAEYNSTPIPQNLDNLIGKTYDYLTVVAYSHTVPRRGNISPRPHWICRCKCGNIVTVSANNLKTHHTRSCGCFKLELIANNEYAVTHGYTRRPEYNIWTSMLNRCYDERVDRYPRYGGRGIKVCKRWRDSFEMFYQDMGPRPSPKHSIDRINNDGDYTPQNCRWATVYEQSNNRSDSRFVTHDNRTMTVSQWAREKGMNPSVLHQRLFKSKWSVERALTEPVNTKYRHK